MTQEITLDALRHNADGSVVEEKITITPVKVVRAPRTSNWVSSADFLKRISLAQYTAIRGAAAQQLAAGNGQLSYWIDHLIAATGTDVSSDDAKAAKAALVAAHLLTQQEADAAFAPTVLR